MPNLKIFFGLLDPPKKSIIVDFNYKVTLFFYPKSSSPFGDCKAIGFDSVWGDIGAPFGPMTVSSESNPSVIAMFPFRGLGLFRPVGSELPFGPIEARSLPKPSEISFALLPLEPTEAKRFPKPSEISFASNLFSIGLGSIRPSKMVHRFPKSTQ